MTAAARSRYLYVIQNEIPLNEQLSEAQEYVLAKFPTMVGNKPFLEFYYRAGYFVQYAWVKREPAVATVPRFSYCNWLYRDQSNSTSKCEVDLSNIHWATPPANLQKEATEEATWKQMVRCISREFIAGLKKIGRVGIDDLLEDDFIKNHLHLAAFGDYRG